MKTVLLSFIFSLVLLSSGMAQQGTVRCNSSISTYVFQQKSRDVSQARTESQRLTVAKNILNSYCLTSEQVKEIASFFLNDYDRLIFAKAAYPKTFDPQNFYDVYDAFAYFSTVFRLHDYVAAHKQGINLGGGNSNNNPTTGSDIKFPNYNYPDPTTDNNPKNCAYPLNNESFIYHYQQIQHIQNDQSKLAGAKNLLNSQCLSTAQVMKLSTAFTTENSRLNLLKEAGDAVYDPSNLVNAEQILTQARNRQNFRDFLRDLINVNINIGGGNGNGNGNGGSNYACHIDQTEFNRIKRNIESQSFNNTKLNTTKQIMTAKGACFTADQVKQLVQLFTFESARLEIAKFAYDYTLDQSNYYIVNEALTYSSSKDELTGFLRKKN